eukprot:TRINITY_DN7159_c0_g2_i1.p1 TRINITY_DN7159_c0_g2~~TRINITY_DN7159_c0_g2_i1.p1  ORF type:complete len:452 (-),score=74.11 TRINITY_DN7159_c0_g2_i1:100-1398(-)
MATSTRMPPNAPNTLAVKFGLGTSKSFSDIVGLFSKYGDVARLDTTLVAAAGLVVVTFFDVRDAQKVLAEFGAFAEPFESAPQDFRTVSVSTKDFAAAPSGGFQSFGEIAGVSASESDMCVEFYDMRAAQQVICTVPGSRPKRSSDLTDAAAAWLLAGGALQAPQARPQPPQTSAEYLRNEPVDIPLPTIAGAMATPKAVGKQRPGPVPTQQAANVPTSNKPIREKVRAQDLLKFDIVPAKILSGEDTRTTVMVRNIAKAISREDFLEQLESCNLADRYTFFYMPFDKRRGTHCGFAFMNLKTPVDVLALFNNATTSLWNCFSPNALRHKSDLPRAVDVVSYARLQGQEALMKHFSLSAVMHDTDETKRPMFYKAPQEKKSHKNDGNNGQAGKESRPWYISVPGLKVPEKEDGLFGLFTLDSVAFLESDATG